MDEALEPAEIAALDTASLQSTYDRMHLLLCDRMQELADALADHQREAWAPDVDSGTMRIYIADLAAWVMTIDCMLLGHDTGAAYIGSAADDDD